MQGSFEEWAIFLCFYGPAYESVLGIHHFEA